MQDKRAVLDKVDCFIFDCDGVIWRGDSVIDGVPETLDMLRSMVCAVHLLLCMGARDKSLLCCWERWTATQP